MSIIKTARQNCITHYNKYYPYTKIITYTKYRKKMSWISYWRPCIILSRELNNIEIVFPSHTHKIADNNPMVNIKYQRSQKKMLYSLNCGANAGCCGGCLVAHHLPTNRFPYCLTVLTISVNTWWLAYLNQ